MIPTGDGTHDSIPGSDATWEETGSPEATEQPPDESGPHAGGTSHCCDGHDAG
jgi:hypothetical protein